MNFVFAFFGQEAEVHRTVERVQNPCRCAEVNGAKTKSLRCGRVEWLITQKRAGQKLSLLSSQSLSMGVLSDDFAAVDFREELCYHSLTEKANSRGTWNRNKTNERKPCAAEKAAADPRAGQRGRLRAAALSRRRKLRFSAACRSKPPALLRYVSSSRKIFASQIFFGNPVDLVFLSFLSVACAWLRRAKRAALVYAKHTPRCQDCYTRSEE